MDIFEVNIYLETSINGTQKVKQAAGEWLVEFVTTKGIPVTRNGLIVQNDTTGNALTLELLKEALSVLTKTCQIQVNTCCQLLLNTMRNHWLPQWRKKGWVNAKGRPVANKELWQQVAELMDDHFMEFVSENHSYRDVMQRDIKRELGK